MTALRERGTLYGNGHGGDIGRLGYALIIAVALSTFGFGIVFGVDKHRVVVTKPKRCNEVISGGMVGTPPKEYLFCRTPNGVSNFYKPLSAGTWEERQYE